MAYFVLEWKEVKLMDPMHGLDQMGDACLVPDYVGMIGMDACLNALASAPRERSAGEPGALSTWLQNL